MTMAESSGLMENFIYGIYFNMVYNKMVAQFILYVLRAHGTHQ